MSNTASVFEDWVPNKLEEVGHLWRAASSGSVKSTQAAEILPKLTDPAEIERRWQDCLDPKVENPGTSRTEHPCAVGFWWFLGLKHKVLN